jgi:hypothetical protein
MDLFDLRTTARPGFGRAPPPGYSVGWVRIDDLDETVFFSTEIWSSSDYAEHWNATAELLLRGEIGLFCTDLTKDNACIFIGFPVEGGFEFEEWVIPRSQLELDGLQLKITRIDRSEGASCWRVSKDAVKAFASTQVGQVPASAVG